MDRCFEVFNVLDSFSYRFSKEDLDKKWIIYGGIKDTFELMDKREKELEKDKEQFSEKMKEE